LGVVIGQIRRSSKGMDDALARSHALKDSEAIKNLKANLSAFTRLSGTGVVAGEPSFTERFPFWVTADVGVAVGFFSEDWGKRIHPGVSMTFGLSFYFAPVDKAEPLHGWTGRDFRRRFSFLAGLTLTQPPQGITDRGVDGVIGSHLGFFGAGVRLTDYVRLSGGALFYTQANPSPLSDKKDVQVAPFAMASVDLDVVGTISTWASSVPKVPQ